MASPKKPVVTRKSAYVNLQEYDEPKMYNRFVDIAASIRERDENELGFSSADATVRQLSVLTGQIRSFVETALGRGSNPKLRKLTKFPHRVYFDYRPHGALDVMLCTVLRFKSTHELRRLDFQNMDKLEFHIDLLLLIEKNLQSTSKLSKLKLYIAPSVPNTAHPALHASIRKRATMVSSAAEATHIIYPDPPNTTKAETDGTDFCRTLEVKNDVAFVHWWYYPDSYDSWVDKSAIEGDPEEDEPHRGAWHVQIRWLEDTDMFNEWMNEIDYEVPEETWLKLSPAEQSRDSPVKTSQRTNEERALDRLTRDEDRHASKKSKKRKRTSSSKDDMDNSRHSSDRHRDRDRNRERRRDGDRDRERRRDRDKEKSRSRKEERRSAAEERIGSKSAHGHSSKDRVRRSDARSDGHSRVRHGDAGASSRRSVSPGASPRKRPRTAEGEISRTSSVKLKLYLKPPPGHVVFRTHERKRSKHDVRDDRRSGRMSESEEKKSAIKVRVRLPMSRESSTQGTAQKEVVSRSQENRSRISGALPGPSRIREKKASSVDAELEGAKEDSVQKRGEPSSAGKHEKSGVREGDKKSAGEEKDRSKSKRRDRRPKVPGVSFVENATPIRESDVGRIRNISLEIQEMEEDSVKTPPNKKDDAMDIEKSVEKSSSPDKDVEMKEESVMAGEEKAQESEVTEKSQEAPRVKAISQQGLLGSTAGAPIMAADIADALPAVVVRIPAQASWFRMDSVHDIEKRSLAEFFNNRSASKTPKVYKIYRDFMIDSWRQNPEKYLSATAARRHLAGDVCAILRVHSFLEHWGLINYGVLPESRPHFNIATGPLSWRPKPVQVDRFTQSGGGVPKLLFYDDIRPPTSLGGPVSLRNALNNAKEKRATLVPLATRQEVYATASAIKHVCDNCQKDCSKMRYECVGPADVKLCALCFANGRYPSTLSSRDFEQLTTVLNSEAYDGSVWSEVENLLLLEGLEKHGDDWNKVAEHVQTKSNEQCLLHFLRLPIEDSFLGDQVGKWNSTSESTFSRVSDASLKPPSEEPLFTGPALPFADASNPIMAQVAFLASSVSPDVAAAAAQAALSQIMKDTVGTPKKPTATKKELAGELLGNANKSSAAEKAPQTANGASVNLSNTRLDGVAVEAAAAVGIAAAAARARKLADAEMEDIERAFAVVIESKLKTIEMKLQEFNEMERHVRSERDRLEMQIQRVYADRVAAAMARVSHDPQNMVNMRIVGAGGFQQTVPALNPSHPVMRTNMHAPQQLGGPGAPSQPGQRQQSAAPFPGQQGGYAPGTAGGSSQPVMQQGSSNPSPGMAGKQALTPVAHMQALPNPRAQQGVPQLSAQNRSILNSNTNMFGAGQGQDVASGQQVGTGAQLQSMIPRAASSPVAQSGALPNANNFQVQHPGSNVSQTQSQSAVRQNVPNPLSISPASSNIPAAAAHQGVANTQAGVQGMQPNFAVPLGAPQNSFTGGPAQAGAAPAQNTASAPISSGDQNIDGQAS